LHQPAVAIEMAFDLDHQRHAAGDERAEIAERHHPLRRILELNRLQFGRGLAEQRAGTLGKAAERVVMMHHRLAIRRKLDVAFDGEFAVDGGLCGRRHVFDDAARNIMQAAVRDRTRRQPVRRAHEGHSAQDTSKMASTSTAASEGREATPTVVRACRPLSPNAATIRSEVPLSTLGPSRKSGAELMKPPSLTTRTTLSRSPSAALTWASRLTPQPCAAA